MAVLIHRQQGLRTLYLTFCQRLVQFEEYADTKISRETFPDPERANNALHAGKVSWESFDWDNDELRINALKELYRRLNKTIEKRAEKHAPTGSLTAEAGNKDLPMDEQEVSSMTGYSPGPFTDSETSCSPHGEPETRRLPRTAQLPQITGLRYIKAPTTAPNAISFEPDGWISTPLLRQPRNPLSNRSKLLIAVGVAALPACYFMFENSDGSIELAVAPQTTLNTPPVEFLPSRQPHAPETIDTNVESRIEPDIQTAPLQPTAPLEAEGGIEARPSHTLPGRGSRSFATGRHDSTCFPSASAARLEHPRGWASWTLRAPGHEGVRCWYVATQTAAHDHSSEMRRRETPGMRRETAQSTEKVEFPALFGLQY